MKVSVITPTKDRPQCLELCKKYVQRQTYKVHEHIIAEGKDLHGNIQDALKKVTGDIVVIFEDDDWYSQNWVELCVRGLETSNLFGQGLFAYYHIPSGGYFLEEISVLHAPLHATAFRSEIIDDILKIDDVRRGTKPILDVYIWNTIKNKPRTINSVRSNVSTINTREVVSLKGLPGLAGYSPSHNQNFYSKFDVDRSVIKSWIGCDVDNYISMGLK